MAAIGVDHVQFSVPDLPEAVSMLAGRGWTLQFEQPLFARGRRPYFRAPDKSMAYLKRGLDAIELIDASPVAGPGRWTPVFDARLPGEPADAPADAPACARGAALGPDGELPVHVGALGGTCYCRDVEADDVALGDLVLSTPDPDASCAFLASLGFRAEAEGGRRRVAFPATFLSMGLRVTVVPGAAAADEAGTESYVDDLGPSLVALISRDVEADRRAQRDAGRRTTDVFEYTINGRGIRNVIVHGPGGELVELIEVGR